MIPANNMAGPVRLQISKVAGTVFRCPMCSMSGVVKRDGLKHYPEVECSHLRSVGECEYVFHNNTDEPCLHHFILTFGQPVYG